MLLEHHRVEVAGEPLDLDQALIGGAGPASQQIVAQPGGLAVIDQPTKALEFGDDPCNQPIRRGAVWLTASTRSS
jgi:hypothetical protein